MANVVFKPQKISTPSLKLGRNSVGGTMYEEIVFQGFAGLNNKYSNVEIEDNEATDLLNVEFDARGAIVKRKGYTLALALTNTQINSIMRFYTSTSRLMVLTAGTNVYSFDPVANTHSQINTTPLSANGARFSGTMDTVHNKLYMVNGNSTDGLMSWDGTTFTTAVPTAPNGKYVLWYKNHLYITGDSTNPNRLYMSDQGDPTTWPALNFLDIDDGYGIITGIAQLGDSIVVFKEQGVFILKGEDISDYILVTTFSGEHGCVSHWSIVRIPNGLLYLSHDGVYLFDGRKFELVSDKIQGSIDVWNQSQLSNAVAFEYDHKYWISVPEGNAQTTNNYTYVFHYIYGWWTKHDLPMQANGSFTGSTMEPTPYFTDTSGNLMQLDQGDNDNGNSIDAYLMTKHFDFGSPAHMKAFKQVFFFALAETGNYQLNLTFTEDFGLQSKTIQMPLSYEQQSQWGSMMWGKDPWGGYGEIAHASTNVPGQARYLQFKVEGSGKDAPFTFLGWIVRFKTKRRMA